MNNIPIKMEKHIKVLGVAIDAALTFNLHIKNVCQKSTTVYKQLSEATKMSWGLLSEITEPRRMPQC